MQRPSIQVIFNFQRNTDSTTSMLIVTHYSIFDVSSPFVPCFCVSLKHNHTHNICFEFISFVSLLASFSCDPKQNLICHSSCFTCIFSPLLINFNVNRKQKKRRKFLIVGTSCFVEIFFFHEGGLMQLIYSWSYWHLISWCISHTFVSINLNTSFANSSWANNNNNNNNNNFSLITPTADTQNKYTQQEWILQLKLLERFYFLPHRHLIARTFCNSHHPNVTIVCLSVLLFRWRKRK